MSFIEALIASMDTPFAETQMRLRQSSGADIEAADTLASDSRAMRTFAQEQYFMSAPEGGGEQEGPYKIGADGSYATLHQTEEDGLELLPEIESKELPSDIWGIGIMTVIMDLEDIFTGPSKSASAIHFFRVVYVSACGFLSVFAQGIIPYLLHWTGQPLIPSWAVNTYDPIQAQYKVLKYKDMTTAKPSATPKHNNPEWTEPRTTTLAPLDILEHVQPGMSHTFVPGPVGTGQTCSMGGFIEVPCGKIGHVLGVFLFLWVAQVLRQTWAAIDLLKFVYNMPRVNVDYSTLKVSPMRPSASNHVITRNKKNEVFALTGCTKFFLIVLMFVKAAFHLQIGFWGIRALMLTTSLPDLIFTFLALWFVGVVLPTPLVESLVPMAMADVKATRFACNDSKESSLYSEPFSMKSMVFSMIFALVTMIIVIVSLTLFGGAKNNFDAY